MFRRFMKSKFLACAWVLLSVSCFAESWEVETLGSEVWASRADIKGLRVLLQRSGAGTPKILSFDESPQARGIYVLKYVAGEIGTSEKVLEVRASAIRLKARRVLVDEVFAYKFADKPEVDSGPQPQWTWTSKLLLIERPDREKPLKISL